LLARRWTGTEYTPAPLGLPDAGLLTSVGLPLSRYLQEIAGIAVVGLLFLRCITLTGKPGPGGQHLLEMAARWAWLGVAGTIAWIAATASDLTGVPIVGLLGQPDLVWAVLGTDRVLAQIATLWVTLAVALFASRLRGSAAQVLTLLLATAALLPSALNGHAGHHESPVVAVSALAVHLVAAAVWVGGLLALVVHLRHYPDQLRVALPRFSTAALICVVAVGLSGIVESAVTLRVWSALWSTDRGGLIIAKTVALAVLAGIGYFHRQRTLGPAGSGRFLPLLGLAAGELIVMGATVGIAVVLSSTAFS
jgi:putative copper resistance protein D